MAQFLNREAVNIALLDEEFLAALSEQKEREIYAKIIALDINELPIDQIEGKVTGGSINIDGTSAVQRTCNLTMVSDQVDINDYYWGIKTKIKLEIGLKNNLTGEFAAREQSGYPEIIWFKQGTFLLTTFNTSLATNNCSISLSGKDKMCMLNGELGGQLFASIDFGTEEYQEKVMTPVSVSAGTSDALIGYKYYKRIHPKESTDVLFASDANTVQTGDSSTPSYTFIVDSEDGEYYKKDNAYYVYRMSGLNNTPVNESLRGYKGNIYSCYQLIKTPDDLFKQVDGFIFSTEGYTYAGGTQQLTKTVILTEYEKVLDELREAVKEGGNSVNFTNFTGSGEVILHKAAFDYLTKAGAFVLDGETITKESLEKNITFYDGEKTYCQVNAAAGAQAEFTAVSNAYYTTCRETEDQIKEVMRESLSAGGTGTPVASSAISNIALGKNYYTLESLYEVSYEYSIKQIPIEKIIREAVHAYAQEPYHNIIINDLDEYGLEQLTFKGDSPVYAMRNVDTQSFQLVMPEQTGNLPDIINEEEEFQEDALTSLAVQNKASIVYYKNNTWKWATPKYDENDNHFLGYFDKNNNEVDVASVVKYNVAVLEYGDDVGYRITDLTYPGDLISSVGESLTSILDKIKTMLGNFEYFYDVNGRFIFQRKRTYVDTVWSQLVKDSENPDESYVDYVNTNRRKFAFNFEGNRLVTAIQNTPVLTNLRNDIVVWGKRKGISGAEIPIHGRYVIDKKPLFYKTLAGKIFISNDADAQELAQGIVGYDNIYATVAAAIQEEINNFTPQYMDAIPTRYLSKPVKQPDGSWSAGWWDIRDWAAYYELLTGEAPVGTMKFYSRNDEFGCVPVTSMSNLPEGYGASTPTSGALWLIVVHPNDKVEYYHGSGAYSDRTYLSTFYTSEMLTDGTIVYTPTEHTGYFHLPYYGCSDKHTYLYFLSLTKAPFNYKVYFYNPNFPSFEGGGNYATIVQEKIQAAYEEYLAQHVIHYVDWREIIYQMALDYFAAQGCSKDNPIYDISNNVALDNPDHFLPKIAELNPGFYPTGYTGYEQYYTDMQGFWRQLYNPFYLPQLVWTPGSYEDRIERAANSLYYSKSKNWKIAQVTDCTIDYFFAFKDNYDFDHENTSESITDTERQWEEIRANHDEIIKDIEATATRKAGELDTAKYTYEHSELPLLQNQAKAECYSTITQLQQDCLNEISSSSQAWKAACDTVAEQKKQQSNEQEKQRDLLTRLDAIYTQKNTWCARNSDTHAFEDEAHAKYFRDALIIESGSFWNDGSLMPQNQPVSVSDFKLKEIDLEAWFKDESEELQRPKDIKDFYNLIYAWNNEVAEYKTTYWNKGSGQFTFKSTDALIKSNFIQAYQAVWDQKEDSELIPLISTTGDHPVLSDFIADCNNIIDSSLSNLLPFTAAEVLTLTEAEKTYLKASHRPARDEYKFDDITISDFDPNPEDTKFTNVKIIINKYKRIIEAIELLKNVLTQLNNKLADYVARMANVDETAQAQKEQENENYEKLKSKWAKYGCAADDNRLYWNISVFEAPETLNFWFECLDGGAELQQFSIPIVGDRTKVVNEDKAGAIVYRDIPDVIVYEDTIDETELRNQQHAQSGYNFIKIPKGYSQFFNISYRSTSVKNKIDELLYQFAYCVENISITALPVYHLEPNTRIYVQDKTTNIEGEYLVSRITLPLTYNGTMSVTATKAPERLY